MLEQKEGMKEGKGKKKNGGRCLCAFVSGREEMQHISN